MVVAQSAVGLSRSATIDLGLLQVISFNMGSLGFLTNHHFKSMQHDLKEVIFGSESLEQCAIDGSVSVSICMPFCTGCAKLPCLYLAVHLTSLHVL